MLTRKFPAVTFLFGAFATLGVLSVNAQSPKVQLEISVAGGLNPARLMESNPDRVGRLNSEADESLLLNHHTLIDARHGDLTSNMQNANLPSTSPRTFDSVDISRSRLDVVTPQLSSKSQEAALLGVNVKELRNGGRLDPASLR
jgi:hypothetical protein